MTKKLHWGDGVENIFKQVEKNIDELVMGNVDWSACASEKELLEARSGKLKLRFMDREIPDEWLGNIKGKRVLCLAGAGGLQAPLLACAGAEVTVVDISEKMLDRDREIAKRENLPIRIIKGNMCDLSLFGDEYFDHIINPMSLMYVPEPYAVFKECYRVLKKGGVFIMAAPCPINYVCDYVEDENGGYYKAVHKMPYFSKDHDDSDWIEYGHSMETYLGGLIKCGFIINGYTECQMEDITELYFMARAIKCGDTPQGG
ncbi:MAG: class I SAM-dependent methyltransferase [Oscillospiraceae bacterium]|nr:class I SAM-dependent methyltransferase [Oscillospiraceae bacterium]